MEKKMETPVEGLKFRVYSRPQVDRIWLWVYFSKIPICPIFYLLKGDYNLCKLQKPRVVSETIAVTRRRRNISQVGASACQWQLVQCLFSLAVGGQRGPLHSCGCNGAALAGEHHLALTAASSVQSFFGLVLFGAGGGLWKGFR